MSNFVIILTLSYNPVATTNCQPNSLTWLFSSSVRYMNILMWHRISLALKVSRLKNGFIRINYMALILCNLIELLIQLYYRIFEFLCPLIPSCWSCANNDPLFLYLGHLHYSTHHSYADTPIWEGSMEKFAALLNTLCCPQPLIKLRSNIIELIAFQIFNIDIQLSLWFNVHGRGALLLQLGLL